MLNKITCFLVFNFWVLPSLLAQGASQPANNWPGGLMQQKVQDPIVLNPKTINSNPAYLHDSVILLQLL